MRFINQTGLSAIETDGPCASDDANNLYLSYRANLCRLHADYPCTSPVLVFNRYGGQPCSSEEHEHHAGLSDSVFRQNILQARFYQQLKAAGLYIHAPDNYYYW